MAVAKRLVREADHVLDSSKRGRRHVRSLSTMHAPSCWPVRSRAPGARHRRSACGDRRQARELASLITKLGNSPPVAKKPLKLNCLPIRRGFHDR